MATENKPKSSATANPKNNKGKKRKQFLPHNRPVKKKGAYPLHPGVQGFFITCDGGRERQASHEAINVIDSFFEELVQGKDTSGNPTELPDKPVNKKIKFVYSSDEGEEEEDDDNDEVEEQDEEEGGTKEEKQLDINQNSDTKSEIPTNDGEEKTKDHDENTCRKNQTEEKNNGTEESGKKNNDSEERGKKNNGSEESGKKDLENQTNEVKEPLAKKRCLDSSVSNSVIHGKVGEKSVDKLIEEELKELGDKSKRLFSNLDSGCNGVVFVQMRKRDGDPSPKDVVQHMMTSAALTRKHMSRFILRVLPVEFSCYASEEEISKAMVSIVTEYFPVDTQEPKRFAVLYEARANSGIDRMKIINAVAKSVPGPHKVDLSNPEISIVVEIVKTVCLIGVVEKYKELAKYNLRQLTSPK